MIFKTLRIFFISALSLASSAAFAQPARDSIRSSEVAPISNALEIAIGGGYMQGVGDIGAGMASVQDISRSGGGAELQLGYRMTPNLAIGAYGTLSSYNTGSRVAPTTDLVIGSTAGAKVDWHFRPAMAADPWLSVGAGWRALWLGNDAATEQKLQGIDVARIQLGIDCRLTPSIALTPYVGASGTVFLAKGDPMGGYDAVDGKALSFSFTGGLLGRFDLGGSRGR